MPFNRPRVGDVVHFIGSSTGAPHRAAVILETYDKAEPRVCVLKVFGEERDLVAYGRVHGDTPGTWHYREECDQ
jgi:hypothetical protein